MGRLRFHSGVSRPPRVCPECPGHLFSALKQRGRERKGPSEISSQKLADFECRFPYDSYGRARAPLWPFLGAGFWGNIRQPGPFVLLLIFDRMETLWRHSQNTLWTLRSPRPKGSWRHPVGHSLKHPRFRGHALGDTPGRLWARRARETPLAGRGVRNPRKTIRTSWTTLLTTLFSGIN